MQNKRKTWRSLTCQRNLLFFAFVIGILNLAMITNLKHVETARVAADESEARSNGDYSKLRRLHEILIKDCESKELHSHKVISNLTREVHSLEMTISNLRDARGKLTSMEMEFNKQLFEANARYRAAETNYEIARSKESSLQNQIEAARVRERNLVSQLERIQREATAHVDEKDAQLRLDTALALHQHPGAGLVTTRLLSVLTDRK